MKELGNIEPKVRSSQSKGIPRVSVRTSCKRRNPLLAPRARYLYSKKTRYGLATGSVISRSRAHDIVSRISDEETTRSVLHQNDRRVVEGRPREVVDHFGVAVQDSSTSSPPTPAALNRVNLVNKMLRATCMQISLEFVAPFMISEMAVAVDAQIQRTGRQSRTYLTIYVPFPSLTAYTPCTGRANEFMISSTWSCMRPVTLWDA